MKLCPKCKNVKEEKFFYSQKDTKDGLRSLCKVCMNSYNKKWNESNPGYSAALARKRYAIDSVADNKKSKLWRTNNPEKCKKANQQWKKNNAQYVNEYNKKRYEENKPSILIKLKEWISKNREKRRLNEKNRRAQKKNGEGKISFEEWTQLLEKYKHKCLRCGKDTEKLTIDHVIPLVKGGSNTIENIQPLCRSCNCSKGKKIIDYRPENIT